MTAQGDLGELAFQDRPAGLGGEAQRRPRLNRPAEKLRDRGVQQVVHLVQRVGAVGGGEDRSARPDDAAQLPDSHRLSTGPSA